MFGFLDPLPRSSSFAAACRRCIRHVELHYGRRCRPFASFEAVFVYLMWRDLMGEMANDEEIGQLCASAGLVLASVKMEDDIRDDASWIAVAACRLLRHSFELAKDFIERRSPGARERLLHGIERHLELERRQLPLPLTEYVAPMGDTFAFAFTIAAPPDHENLFAAVGSKVGAALCAFDCAIDWRQDQNRGSFNPLRNEGAATEALGYARDQLLAAERICRDALGESAESRRTLQGVIVRLDRRCARRSNAHALLSPSGSHLESSASAEFRDKILFSLMLLGGIVVDAIASLIAPSIAKEDHHLH